MPVSSSAALKALDVVPDDIAVFRISLVSKLTGVSMCKIRRWESRGLIERRTSKGQHRFYSKRDIEKIQELSNLGL